MQIIAHRGASGYKPENTISSFTKALSMGIDMIELDVHLTADGKLVVIHDETVDRTTDGTGHVADYNFDQLRTLDAGRGQQIPLLSEVIDLVNKRVPINIELKGEGTAQPLADLIQQYLDDKGWTEDLFVVSSFDLDLLAEFAQLMPYIHTGALYEGEPLRFLAYARSKHTYSANFNSVFVTNKEVYRAHQRGLMVYVYTVNDGDEAERMEELHVDGIFSDYPDKMARYVSHA